MAKSLADRLTMPILARLWQMLLKGVSEVRVSPSPISALDMLLVRIAYAAQLPTPAEVIRSESSVAPQIAPVTVTPQAAPVAPAPAYAMAETPAPKWESALPQATLNLKDFPAAVALFEQNKELILSNQLKANARLVSFAPGKIELRLTASLPRDFIAKAGECLTRWTGQPWKVLLSDAEGEPTLKEQEMARKEKQLREASANPLVSSVLEQFPGAKLIGIKETA